jgi:hypothetical protein
MIFRSKYFDSALLCPGAYDAIKTRSGFRGGRARRAPPLKFAKHMLHWTVTQALVFEQDEIRKKR